ncbi:hypothetical protein TCAL_00866 [Tigriopus californicus]|uniref:PCI domain-containing protein n=1 Tax=Tigriopus californicus TaxID=6832 RepID=A0A553NAT7_TIGCA|nr:COP9 signalosome complex subunit 7a-like [Tigriopus californicus]TRY62537.1 hypothetical protein TCAL_00866 [Tigriopus californicus]|eukprot:TCALIF_00866-PA protein Name:"Similar to Cops7a COP9 signalosome complex subunit 7a (Mus musculus)" AED:0.18 eAED:0.18 QI:450/1/1/1/1/1/3/103/314
MNAASDMMTTGIGGSTSSGLTATSTSGPAVNSSLSTHESFLLLANGAKGAALIALVKQVLESPNVFVFGELLDHPNIQAMKDVKESAAGYHALLEIFAYADYSAYQNRQDQLPPLSPPMSQKLRLLTLCSMATTHKILPYARLQTALALASVRELEDLIIEGASANVIQGKLDQQLLHFEVDFTMARDIQRNDIPGVLSTLEAWCTSCDHILTDLEEQVQRANEMKQADVDHKNHIEAQVSMIRKQIKAQHQHSGEGAEDPDSQMVSDRLGGGSGYDRRDKKTAKNKGQRTQTGGGASSSSGASGSQAKGFWHK